MKKTICILLLTWSILPICNVFGQHKQIDSLTISLKNYTKEDSNRVNLLLEISYAYYRTDADSTLFFATEGKKMAEKIHYPIGFAKALRHLGIGYWVKGEYEKTIQLSQEAIRIFEKYNLTEEISRCYNTIGMVYYRKKSYEQALKYFEKGLQIDKLYNYEQNIGIKLTNIGIVYDAQQEYEKALISLFQSLNILKKLNFRQFIPITLRHIGEVYFHKQDYVKAELFANKTLNATKFSGSDREITLAYLLLGKIAKERKKYFQAENFLLKSFDFARKTKEIEHDKEVVEVLYEFYKLQKNDNKALKYHELFKMYQDSLSSEKAEKEIKNLEFNYQIRLKEKEIDLLKKENLLQEDKSKTQQLLLIAIIIAAILVALLALILLRGRMQQQKVNYLLTVKNAEISQNKEELSVQSKQLQEANSLKDRLFSIIAHDLRSPLATLQGLLELFTLGGITHEEAVNLYPTINQQLAGLQSTLASLLQWAKAQITGKEPHKEYFNLHQLISDKVRLFQVTASAKQIDLVNEIPANMEIYADINQLRIVFRNLIANAIKFTNTGGKVAIKAQETAHYIEIQIEDSGIGMTEEQLAKLFNIHTHFSKKGTNGEKGTGLGLLFTKDFVEKNGGTIIITSMIDVGTTFTIRLPKSE